MGTCYYTTEESDPGLSYGTGGEQLLIGKASAGWAFLFASHPRLGLASCSDWMRLLGGGRSIWDEYNKDISLSDFHNMVVLRKDWWTGRTAPALAWGPDDPDKHEYLDGQGYRISHHSDFS